MRLARFMNRETRVATDKAKERSLFQKGKITDNSNSNLHFIHKAVVQYRIRAKSRNMLDWRHNFYNLFRIQFKDSVKNINFVISKGFLSMTMELQK